MIAAPTTERQKLEASVTQAERWCSEEERLLQDQIYRLENSKAILRTRREELYRFEAEHGIAAVQS